MSREFGPPANLPPGQRPGQPSAGLGREAGSPVGPLERYPVAGRKRPRWRRWLGRLVVLALVFSLSWAISWLPHYSKNAGFHLVPVAGTVWLDGEPLGDARLVFIPLERDFERALQDVSVATTDRGGSFKLETLSGRNGAARGRHLVYVLPPLDVQSWSTDEENVAPFDPWREVHDLLDWVSPRPVRQETNIPVLGTRNLKLKLERTAGSLP